MADLIRLEGYALHGPRGFVDAMAFGSLRDRHPEDYEAITGELAPQKLAAEKQRRASISQQDGCRQEAAGAETSLSRYLNSPPD